MLTGDPRVVENARLIEHIRFDEASELAAFGAKVLHPSTIAPAVKRGIPVFIYNSRRPEGRGTRITSEAPRRAVTAIAGKGEVTVVKIRSPRMLLAHGVLRSIFEVFERHRVSVDVVATSEVSVSMTVDEATPGVATPLDARDLVLPELDVLALVLVVPGEALAAHGDHVGAERGDLQGRRLRLPPQLPQQVRRGRADAGRRVLPAGARH